MACATLKRSLDWDSINQRPSKRRRCNPFGQPQSPIGRRISMPVSPCSSSSNAVGIATGSGTSGASCGGVGGVNMGIGMQRCPCGRINGSSISRNAMDNQGTPESPFVCIISPYKMAQNIRDEAIRLNRRKQLSFANDRMQDSESSGSEMGGADSPRGRADSPHSMATHPEKALFTFKQVQKICEQMLKEREEDLREKYDAILTNKLAEQYDAFVKFTYDQIQKRYEAAPSYLS